MSTHLVVLALAAGVPLAGSLALHQLAVPLTRRLSPAVAAVLLTVLALLLAVGGGLSLCVGALYGLARVPLVRQMAHWPLAAAAGGNPVPAAVGLAAGALALGLLASALRRAAVAAHDLVVSELTCRQLVTPDGRLVVLDDDYPDAYALAALSGRVVVSTGMLRVLDPGERQALLAHEEAHLRHRHHLLLLLTQLAAAADPLLRPAVTAVHFAVERWADESAARRTGNRALVARSIAKASLAQAGARRAAPSTAGIAALGAIRHAVVLRTRALLDPAPAPASRRALATLTLAVIIAIGASSLWLAHDTEHHFEWRLAAGATSAGR